MNEFTVRIEAPELAKAITNLASALSILCVTVEEQGTRKPENTAPVSSKKPGTVSAESGEKPVAATAENRETAVRAEVPTGQKHTIEEVRAAFSEYARSKGKDKAKELLSKYGAAKVTELKAEDYEAAIRDIKES